VTLNFNNSAAYESTLRPLCEEIEKYFQFPADKCYCYFAVKDDEYFTAKIGRYYRGFHFPKSSIGEVPAYARGRYLPPDTPPHDHFVYIRNSTCLDPTACAVTYAHEMQHIVQHDRFPKLAEANWVLYDNLATFEPGATEVDIPVEVDANIVSKHVAEKLCGVESVRKFAEQQVRLMRDQGTVAAAAAQEVRWEYFLNTPSATAYDFVDATVKLVKRYEGRMDFGMDVSAPNWWKGPLVEKPRVGLL
jgi:hypothetical protein